MLGIWKNFDEMETNLTLAELESLLEAKREREYDEKKFMAALKGVDLESPKDESAPSFEDIKNRAAAKNRGVSQEALEFSQIGIAFEGDD
ncbi:tail assembly chaperone [Streptomyces phage Coruscant]|uniref:Tail assembly chaperone n=1 Tax=Streptomyces phage Coruscant TaxID=2739834 RepID=A0A7G4AW00_9CAUD|nr:tail assembly chaperone [Streptomyces phage Coruscant]QMP84190.1 tail assembly chaperone [Streptomyces phage Coruscant]